MPTYDYKCEACGRTFEFFQSMNDPRLETCIHDDCQGAVKRLLGTGAGIIFKGSGFYETDYRSESYKKGQESAEKSTTKESGGGEGKSSSDGKSKPESSPQKAAASGDSSGGGSGSTTSTASPAPAKSASPA